MNKITSVGQFIQAIEIEKTKERRFSADLFRGQTNSTWGLQTTLERAAGKLVLAKKYFALIDMMKPKINSILGTDFKSYSTKAGHPFKDKEFDSMDMEIPDLNYMIFLRHHGFPTPILDWSHSPYVALYFATEGMENNKDGAVYFYREASLQSFSSDEPRIHRIGFNIQTHKRHFAQQADYLLPKYFDSTWKFADMKFALSKNGKNGVLKRYVIPKQAKKSIQAELHKMNINAFTLYMDNDSFIKSLFESLNASDAFRKRLEPSIFDDMFLSKPDKA